MTKKERPVKQTDEEVRIEAEQMTGALDEYAPSDEIIFEMLKAKLEIWKNTVYDAGLDAKVALCTEDKRMLSASQTRLKNALKAVEFLEAELDTISRGDDGEEEETPDAIESITES